MSRSWRDPVEADRLWPVWYGLALVTGVVASGRWTVAVAAWLSALFLLRFVRTQRPLRGFLLGVPLVAVTFYLPWRGLIPGLGDLELAVAALPIGVLGMVVFMIDRALYPRLRGLRSTLVFPAAAVAMDFLFTRSGDAGSSFGLVGYTQYGHDALVQVASLAGLWGVSFLIFWAASVANHVWERRRDLRAARVPATVFAAALLATLLHGGLRLALAAPAGETVRVAMIAEPGLSGPASFWPSGDVAGRYYRGEPLTDVEWTAVGAGAAVVHDRLLERAAAEAAAGARLIAWAEANAPVRAEDEAALLERGAALARGHGAYLAMALLVLPRDIERRLENKIVMLDPAGDIVAEYHKAVPVPGFEARLLRAGADRPAIVETPFGRVALAICYDLDFPQLIRRAGRDGADILIGPSNDWDDIARIHMEMATFRAIEQGVALVRPTTGGVSIATDPHGRVLARMDFRAGGRSTSVDVPARGVSTLYTRIGDLLAWACLFGFLAFIAEAVLTARRRRSPEVGVDAPEPVPAGAGASTSTA